MTISLKILGNIENSNLKKKNALLCFTENASEIFYSNELFYLIK